MLPTTWLVILLLVVRDFAVAHETSAVQRKSALVQVLQHNRGLVLQVRFSPDGKLLAAGTSAQETIVWDMATHRIVATVATPNRTGTFFATGTSFSRDGNLLASAQCDKAVEIRDTRTWQVLHRFPCDDYHAFAVAFHPDQTQLAVSDADAKTASPVKLGGIVKVWDTKTEKLIATMKGHHGWIESVTYSPDGKLLATASCDKTAVIWDAGTGKQVHTLRGHEDWVKEVVFRPDGQRVATAGRDGNLKVWDVASGKENLSLTAHKGGVWGAQFSPDGKLIASAGWSEVPRRESLSLRPRGEMKLWDSLTGQQETFLEEPDGIYSVAFSPNGGLLATSYSSGTLKIWDVAKLLEKQPSK